MFYRYIGCFYCYRTFKGGWSKLFISFEARLGISRSDTGMLIVVNSLNTTSSESGIEISTEIRQILESYKSLKCRHDSQFVKGKKTAAHEINAKMHSWSFYVNFKRSYRNNENKRTRRYLETSHLLGRGRGCFKKKELWTYQW